MCLVPAPDIALMWHCHAGLSAPYSAFCALAFGAAAQPWSPSAYLRLANHPDLWRRAYAATKLLYENRYEVRTAGTTSIGGSRPVQNCFAAPGTCQYACQRWRAPDLQCAAPPQIALPVAPTPPGTPTQV